MTAMMDKLNTQPRHLYSNLVRGSPGGQPPPLLVLLIHPRILIQEYPVFDGRMDPSVMVERWSLTLPAMVCVRACERRSGLYGRDCY